MSFPTFTGYTQHMLPRQSYSSQPVYMPHGPPPSQQQQQQQQPRPVYFVNRTNGSTVPLIPADELPFDIRLEGAPRNMSPDQTFGMLFLGTFPPTGLTFETTDDATNLQRSASQPGTPTHHRQYSYGKQYMAPDALARQAATNAANHVYNTTTTTSSQRSGAASPSVRNTAPALVPLGDTRPGSAPTLTNPQDVIDAIVNSKSGAETAARVGYTAKSAVSTPPSGRKEYCTFWIRTGGCDYTQQGCMYKHEMPGPAKLEQLGFRGTPRWWAEKISAVKLGAGGGARTTAGPAVKAKDWLRRESAVSSTESAGSGSGGVTAGMSSKGEEPDQLSGRRKEVEESWKTKRHALEQGKVRMVHPKSARRGKSETETSVPSSKRTPSASESSTSYPTDNLIDFEALEPQPSSVVPALTPPSSIDSSPVASRFAPNISSPTNCKSEAIPTPTQEGKSSTIFVPKGESKSRHLAEHARRDARATSLEKQIQQAQKNKHGAGPMASQHAPGNQEKRGSGGKTATACRVRRPASALAVRCVDIPTSSRVKGEEKEKEKD